MGVGVLFLGVMGGRDWYGYQMTKFSPKPEMTGPGKVRCIRSGQCVCSAAFVVFLTLDVFVLGSVVVADRSQHQWTSRIASTSSS